MAWANDYVEVKDRIAAFRADHPEASILSTPPIIVTIDDKTFVQITSEVWLRQDDVRPVARASSLEPYPGKTNFTRDSEAENAETSAIGRALGQLGYGSGASGSEIRARPEPNGGGKPKPKPEPAPTQPPANAVPVADMKKRVLNVVAKKYPGAGDDYHQQTAGELWKSANVGIVIAGNQGWVPEDEQSRVNTFVDAELAALDAAAAEAK